MIATPMLDKLLDAQYEAALLRELSVRELYHLVLELRALRADRDEWKDLAANRLAILSAEGDTVGKILDSVRHLMQTGDTVLTCVQRLAPPPTPPRVLREVKGVTYRDERFYHRKSRYVRVVDLMAHFPSTFTDADHAAIYALKDDPYEPVETVKDALIAFTQEWNVAFDNDLDLVIDTFTHRLRAAVLAETGGAA